MPVVTQPVLTESDKSTSLTVRMTPHPHIYPILINLSSGLHIGSFRMPCCPARRPLFHKWLRRIGFDLSSDRADGLDAVPQLVQDRQRSSTVPKTKHDHSIYAFI
jgi:hypothetical protein